MIQKAQYFGDGWLMNWGYKLLWMVWQWRQADGTDADSMPTATDHGKKIKGLVRSNFIMNSSACTEPLAHRNTFVYSIRRVAEFRKFYDGAGPADGRAPS